MFFQNTPFLWLFQSYWRDEAFSVLLAQKPFFELINITARDFSPPLYYIMLKYWIMLWGSSEVATRSFSILAFTILFTTLLIYFWGVEKLNFVKVAIVGLTILLSPILTYYAFEARMYAWAALFATASWLALFRKKYPHFVLLSVLGLYTQYFQLLVILSQFAYIVTSEITRSKNRSDFFKLFLKTWGMPFLKIGIMFLPWVIFVIISHSSSTTSFWIKKPSLDLVANTPAVLTTGYEKDFNIMFGLLELSVPIYILILVSAISQIKIPTKSSNYFSSEHFAHTLWFLLPATLVSVLSVFGPSLYLPRYLIVSSPAFFFFITDELKKKRLIFSVILMAIILLQLKNYQDLQIKYRTKEDFRKIFAKINNETKKGDVLYLESELDFHLAQYYFKYPEKVYVVGKPYSELPPYVGKSMIPESSVSVSRPSGETGLWLKSDRSTPQISTK